LSTGGCNGQLLGLLSDLLHNKISLDYAGAWRSDVNLASAHQLLLGLWIEEEKRLNVRGAGRMILMIIVMMEEQGMVPYEDP
jgi:hypothetical protein